MTDGGGMGLGHDAGPGRGITGLALRVALLAVVVAGVFQLQAAAGYVVPTGSITFQLRPAWPGGHLVLPLGPAGELSLRTHRTPVDVIMDYRLPAQTAALLGEPSAGLPRLEGGARDAFSRYLAGRLPWLLLVGAAAGVLVVGSGTRRRLVLAAAGGAAAAMVLGGAFALATYATLDRSPEVRYAGLASRVPAVLPLLRALSSGGDQSDRLSRLQDFLDGLEAVATQLTTEPRRPARADVVRLLLASDIHDNVFGARAAARLAAGGGEPVDAVLLAGDITDRGTAEEARLFVRVFGRRGPPVLLVGGNHEDEPALRVFRGAGYRVLEGTIVELAGVRILGASDPAAWEPRVSSDAERLAVAGARLAGLWQAADPRPQLLLVHDVLQAQDTIAAVGEDAAAEEEALVVAYGNDHVAGVQAEGDVVLVDAGTAGASGYEAIGAASPTPSELIEPPSWSRSVYTFQLIDFSRSAEPRLTAVTTVSYTGTGRTVVTYTPFEP
ncbi:MAG: metallophosphoesterase family protein [Deltaproteobacteria bacterium]